MYLTFWYIASATPAIFKGETVLRYENNKIFLIRISVILILSWPFPFHKDFWIQQISSTLHPEVAFTYTICQGWFLYQSQSVSIHEWFFFWQLKREKGSINIWTRYTYISTCVCILQSGEKIYDDTQGTITYLVIALTTLCFYYSKYAWYFISVSALIINLWN